MRLNWAGTILVTVTILAIVLTRIVDPDNVNAGFAGLAMTYTSSISNLLSSLNTTAVELETRVINFVNVLKGGYANNSYYIDEQCRTYKRI